MTDEELVLRPSGAAEIFLILHEHHERPADREYEYATGQLRDDLDRRKFGEPMSQKSIERLRELGAQLKGKPIDRIITQDFIVTRETAQHLAAAAGLPPATTIQFDPRVRESDLSYLSIEEFKALGGREAAGERNATLLHWMARRPDDFQSLVRGYIQLWNETLGPVAGGSWLFVLHVEGILLLTAACLGMPPSAIGRLLVPRNCPVHISLAPDRDPIVCICDMETWKGIKATPFAWYG